MKDAIQQIGSVAGLASFLGLAVLAVLYFLQARHVRDLEEKATFVPDDVDLPTIAPASGQPATGTARAAPASRKERKAAAAAAGKDPEAQLEAARQVEVARAAAERRQRFQERRGGSFMGRGRGSDDGGGSGRRRPEPRAMVVIGLGVLVLIAGIAFGVTRLTGGDDKPAGAADPAANVQGTGAPVEVAVLNGTPVPGLAAKIGEEVRAGGGFKVGAVTNTASPFDVTEVMFDPSDPEAQAKAQEVAAKLQVAQVTPITGEIKKAAEGATIVVIVGEDRAGT